ncbi:unnamed protein product [Rhizoctonia solani]|uniref:F-box domain-containing protein n=1 Tax=Rhizoctonia solani TaxID=456999 RepID=A0A8H3HVX8_9AGAM|nr:unnamed protein product [Rhizoctonia solani]
MKTRQQTRLHEESNGAGELSGNYRPVPNASVGSLTSRLWKTLRDPQQTLKTVSCFQKSPFSSLFLGYGLMSNADELVNLTPNGPPLRKRRVLGTLSKQTKPKVTNKIKGKLSGMFSLPIEVFIEIIRHVALPDLLSLSRSSKFFHQMLMTRSATTLGIWQTAVENVPGLPACPKDLCEPQYAALIYSKHCSMCGTSVAKPMDPYLNIRLCKDCIELQYVL